MAPQRLPAALLLFLCSILGVSASAPADLAGRQGGKRIPVSSFPREAASDSAVDNCADGLEIIYDVVTETRTRTVYGSPLPAQVGDLGRSKEWGIVNVPKLEQPALTTKKADNDTHSLRERTMISEGGYWYDDWCQLNGCSVVCGQCEFSGETEDTLSSNRTFL